MFSERQLLRGIFRVLATTEVRHAERDSRLRKGNKLIRRWACYEPSKPRITLFKHDDWLGRVDSIIHEILHAVYPGKTEEEILALTDEVAEYLWEV